MYARQLLGYERLDNPELVAPLNELFRSKVSALRNHFFPVRRLKAVRKDGKRATRVYDEPKTPYQRVLDSAYVTEDAKDKLRAIHQTLNPVKLRREIRLTLRALLKHPTPSLAEHGLDSDQTLLAA